MKSSRLATFLGISLASVPAGCVGSQPTDTRLLDPPRPTQSSYPISRAIESAATLLREHHLDWGEPRQVLRTGSNWYRLEYARGPLEPERVVLVNPANDQAEFPFRR